MKFKRLRNFLLKISAGFAVILIIAGGGYYMLSDWDDSLQDEITGLKSSISAAQSDTRTVEKQVNGSQAAIDYYRIFSASESGNIQNYRRDYARNLLARLRDRDSIVDVKLNMEPFNKAAESSDKLKVALYASNVTVQIAADTDVDFFNFIRDICELFPGYVRIKSYKLKRNAELNDQVLLAIGEGRYQQGLVTGEFSFDWQSIQDNPDYKAPEVKGAPGAKLPANVHSINPANPGPTPPNG